MEGLQNTQAERSVSPDPASHAANVYDASATESAWVNELDDDDMDFDPETEESEDNEFFDLADGEEEDAEFHATDAEDSMSGFEIEVSVDDGETGQEEQEAAEAVAELLNPDQSPATGTGRRIIQVSANQIMQLLNSSGLRTIHTRSRGDPLPIVENDDDDSDDERHRYGSGRRRRRRAKPTGDRCPAVPSDEGTRLMRSGTFGCTDYYQNIMKKRKKRLARRLLSRELGADCDNIGTQEKILCQDLIPSSNADTIIHYNARCYSGQFSDDGNFFFSCAQDFKVRMYDTSNPYRWRYYKTVTYPFGQWTITDATLSPDNRFLAYSSIRSTTLTRHQEGGVFVADTIWSIRFSGDGREIVAGTSGRSVHVYDIESRQSVLSIEGHGDDVNAVCFGDTSSPHILYSGSDDTLIKVWDRRSMGDSREAGVFMGHTEGLTYVDSKGDGRYVLSNGKDQTMKLWDLRKMMSTEKSSTIDAGTYTRGFDYRFMSYPDEDYEPHPHDCSLVTYRGHSVLKTLIRCHFSPPGSTNSRYVYSGSEDGSIYIYNLDATLAGKIDVNQATLNTRPKDPNLNAYSLTYDMDDHSSGAWKTCVRDASWHPNAPVIAATSWNGWGMATGTCTTHSWNDGADDDEGDPKMGLRVNQVLDEDEDLYDSRRRGARSLYRGLRSRPMQATTAAGAAW